MSKPQPTVMCRHCQKKSVTRPRGLCWTCYYTPGLRELYPSTSKHAFRSEADFNGSAPLPDAPTTAPPATEERIAVMRERARKGQILFHPSDANYEGDPRPLDYLRHVANTRS